MDVVTLGTGVVIILFGLYTLLARIKFPEKFAKLEAMKERFGRVGGLLIHTIAYIVIPVFFGSLLVVAGLNGVSLAEFFISR